MGRYQVFGDREMLKYKSYAQNTIADREILDVYDAEEKKIGYIKEHIISGRVPGIETKAKTCSVYLGTAKIATLRHSVEKIIGDREHDVSVLDGPYRVACDFDTFERDFQIYKSGKKLAEVCQKLPSFKTGYVDKLIVDYYGEENEKIVVLLSIALDVIC